jgi:hypothetical protein
MHPNLISERHALGDLCRDQLRRARLRLLALRLCGKCGRCGVSVGGCGISTRYSGAAVGARVRLLALRMCGVCGVCGVSVAEQQQQQQQQQQQPYHSPNV